MGLSRQRILHTAVQLLDQHGPETLSMRRLGRALGVEAMSLYRYVRNKEDLLDGVHELLLSEPLELLLLLSLDDSLLDPELLFLEGLPDLPFL